MGDLVDWVLPAVRVLPEEAGCEAVVEEALVYHARPSAQPLLQTGHTTLREGVERLLLIGGEVQMLTVKLSLTVMLWLEASQKNSIAAFL